MDRFSSSIEHAAHAHARGLRRGALITTLALTTITGAALPADARDGLNAAGGIVVPGTPRVRDAVCTGSAPWTCHRGDVLTLRGDSLAGARAIDFLGRRGRRDDVRVRIRARAARSVELLVQLPRRARSGRLRVIGATGAAALTAQPLHVAARAASSSSGLVAGEGELVVSYIAAAAPAPAGHVEAVRIADGAVVRRWPLEQGSATVRWDGILHGAPVHGGAYLLRLDAVAAQSAAPDPLSPSSGVFDEGVFPIRGAHELPATPAQRFGGARHHQGSDTFADCGTPLVAWTAGVVQLSSYQGAAGNYLVVRRPDGEAYAYMHLREPSKLKVGEEVRAGEHVGEVGQSGDAQGCHLHLETWTAPGYYRGGHPVDSQPLMERLDAQR